MTATSGVGGPTPEHSDVPGLEVSGHIVGCGQNISRERIGRPVMALTDGGGYGEYVVTHSALAFDCPSGLDLVSVSSFPEALFTTWLNFFTLMRLEPAEKVLIHGGASGVGSIAIQVLRALGHAVFVTAGTEAKRNVALDLGATVAFDYADEALAERIKSAVGEKRGRRNSRHVCWSAYRAGYADSGAKRPNIIPVAGKKPKPSCAAAAYDDQAHQIDRRNAGEDTRSAGKSKSRERFKNALSRLSGPGSSRKSTRSSR